MTRKLTAAQVQAAFDEFVVGLAKQHLRVPFRNRFGTGREVEFATFKRGTVQVLRDKPVKNLLQEQPETLVCTRFSGTKVALATEDWNSASDLTLAEMLGGLEGEQGLLVQGRRARLYIYADSTSETVSVLRIATELFGEEKKAPPPKPSRKARGGVKPSRPTSRPKGRR